MKFRSFGDSTSSSVEDHWRIQGAIRPTLPTELSIVVAPVRLTPVSPMRHALRVALKSNLA